jgi:hypothetical protein
MVPKEEQLQKNVYSQDLRAMGSGSKVGSNFLTILLIHKPKITASVPCRFITQDDQNIRRVALLTVNVFVFCRILDCSFLTSARSGTTKLWLILVSSRAGQKKTVNHQRKSNSATPCSQEVEGGDRSF